jgi:tetratricopeptide (TPR) repeat protein
VSNIGGWGLGSLASTWLFGNYVNPYYTVSVDTQPAASTIVYDYSQPININAPPPETSSADSTEQVFSAARDSFKAGDYQRALTLIDQVIKATPNAPVVHEFRSLCLFALKRYDDAASVVYAVLSSGPCWDWTTLVGLYPDVETYTNQVRALEAVIRSDLKATPPRFLLAYHYLVQGHNDAAAVQFAEVAKHEPKDQLSASFAKALAKTQESTASPASAMPSAVAGASVGLVSSAPFTSAATAPAPASTGTSAASSAVEPTEPPSPPPADLAGTWKANPSPDTTVTFKLEADGAYTWNVDTKGQRNASISGRAYYLDNVLSLTQDDGPPLAGKVESRDASKFAFRLMGGGSNAPVLNFTH